MEIEEGETQAFRFRCSDADSPPVVSIHWRKLASGSSTASADTLTDQQAPGTLAEQAFTFHQAGNYTVSGWCEDPEDESSVTIRWSVTIRPTESGSEEASTEPADSQKHQEDTSSGPCADGGADSTDSQQDQSTREVQYINRSYQWTYAGSEWTWSPSFSQQSYEFYHNRSRSVSLSGWAAMATDPWDDLLINQVACVIEEAADQGGYSSVETLEFTLAFVQSLRYVDDQVGTGFDDYPKFPMETLVEQGGDCEDSSILFATLAEALGYDTVLFYIPNATETQAHMGVGVAGVQPSGGTYYEYDGKRYYYVETTGSGWAIGEWPDSFESAQAHILPSEPQAVLGELTWDNSGTKDGYYWYEFNVTNVGSATVENLTFWAGWDAGDGRAWSVETWSQGRELPPGYYQTVRLYLRPPPEDVHTRLTVLAWGTNAAATEAYSEYFET